MRDRCILSKRLTPERLDDLMVQMFSLKLTLLSGLLLLLATATEGALENKIYYFVFSPFEPYFNNSLTYDMAAIGDGYVSLTSADAELEFCPFPLCIGRVYYKTPGRPHRGIGVSFSTNFVFSMVPYKGVGDISVGYEQGVEEIGALPGNQGSAPGNQGTGGAANYVNTTYVPGHNGDGIVFFLGTNATWDHGQPDGKFGLFSNVTNFTDANPFFAIEFDTMKNVEFGDVDGNHVGVDNNNPISSYYESANKSDIILNNGSRIGAWIDYDNAEKKLEVRLAYHQLGMQKPTTPLISVSYDLDQINLPEFYPGFSSSSKRGSHQRHIIYTWEFDARFVWQHDELLTSTMICGIVVIAVIWFCCVRYTNCGKRQHARCMKFKLFRYLFSLPWFFGRLFGCLCCCCSRRSKVVEKGSAKNIEKKKVGVGRGIEPKKGEAAVKKKVAMDAKEDKSKKFNKNKGSGGGVGDTEDQANSKFKALSRIHPMLVNFPEDKDSDEEEADEESGEEDTNNDEESEEEFGDEFGEEEANNDEESEEVEDEEVDV